MESRATQPSEWFNPAPYGQACAACSRAKCKCFSRPGGSQCERCHRLGRSCEPSMTARKRKARGQPQPQPPTRLEEKLDNIVALLRSQTAERHAQGSGQTTVSPLNEYNTPSSLSLPVDSSHSIASTPVRDPDVVIDTTASVVQLLRPTEPWTSEPAASSPILADVSIHRVPDSIANEQLVTFRRAFLSMFPFVHIPDSMRASELRQTKPFLWLVIMCFTTKLISQQFAMEETIWQIISKRVVSEHLADLDLLHGIVCFASWSHYFKKDKPFMTTLAQLAVSLALDLDLHKDTSTQIARRGKSGQSPIPDTSRRHRTLEERRIFLAVFHLTSSTWSTYRKTEPLRWTPYMDKCIHILSEKSETYLDILLVTQVKCQIITNQLTCPPQDEVVGAENSRKIPQTLSAAMLGKLREMQESLTPQLQVHSKKIRPFLIEENLILAGTPRFYLESTELTIRETCISRSKTRDHTGFSSYKRLQELDSVLTSIERWLALLFDMPLSDWIGISVDHFSQFLHCLVVLFKLTTLDEPGWNRDDVKSRADVFAVIDRTCYVLDRIPGMLGMVDADGPRSGLFFKTTYLFRAIKVLLLAEMAPEVPRDTAQSHEGDSGAFGNKSSAGDGSIPDQFIINLAAEPWLSDIFMSTWDLGLGDSNEFDCGQPLNGWA